MLQQIIQPIIQLDWHPQGHPDGQYCNAALQYCYAAQASANSWSQDILAMQIDSDLFRHQGSAVTTFDRTIPSP